MAEQTLIQVRIDKALKEEVSEIYEMLGLDLPTAIRMFLVRSKLERGLPFKAVLPEETVSPRRNDRNFEKVTAVRPKGGQKISLPKGAKAEKVPGKALTKRRKSDIL